MTEQEILNTCMIKIKSAVDHCRFGPDNYPAEIMMADIRTEVQEAMRKARKEALRGN